MWYPTTPLPTSSPISSLTRSATPMALGEGWGGGGDGDMVVATVVMVVVVVVTW